MRTSYLFWDRPEYTLVREYWDKENGTFDESDRFYPSELPVENRSSIFCDFICLDFRCKDIGLDDSCIIHLCYDKCGYSGICRVIWKDREGYVEEVCPDLEEFKDSEFWKLSEKAQDLHQLMF